MAQRTNRTEKLDLRLSRAAKQTLQAAATAERKSVSEFVLDTALSEAEERLADRRVFTLDAKSWDAFVAALDRRRAVMRALSGCFKSRPCSIPKANHDAFASYRKIASHSQGRAIYLRTAGA